MRLVDLSRSKNDAYWNGRPPVFNGTNSPLSLIGKPTIHFDSLNSPTNGSGLKTRLRPGITGSAPRSIFVVMRHDRNHSMMVNMGNTTTKGSLFSIELTNYFYLPNGWRTANRVKMASTNWNILETVYDGINQKGYVNGILLGMNTNRLNTADKEIEIGLRTATAGKNAKVSDGDFAELLVYDRALNFIERKQVEDYLGGKWFGKKSKSTPAQNPYVWFIPPVEGMTSFSYSKENGLFLFSTAEGKYGSLWQYEPLTASLSRLAQGASFQDEQWSGDNEYAYFLHDKHGGIVLKDLFGTEDDQVLKDANVRWFTVTPDGQKLLMLGTVTNEPSAGIWEYDLISKKLQVIVPYSDYPSVYAQDIVPFDKLVKTSWGTNLVAMVFPPPNFNPHKKYPLVIGDTSFVVAVNGAHGRQWVPCVAAGGAYVVIVERRGGWFNGIENWGEDVMAAYNSLKRDIRIDPSQIYLFGSSVETAYMDSVLTNSPGFWKGLILLNPSGLPDLSNAPRFQQRPKILISVGGDENEEPRLKGYQEDALKSGVMVEYLIHPGEGHHLVSNVAQLERTKAIMHFIFEE
jgi:predicted esterase